MLPTLRSSRYLTTLAALVFGLALSLALISFSPTIASAQEGQTYPVSGKVTAKTADTFTMLVNNNNVTFRITATTQFTQGGKPATFGAMQVGMQISAQVAFEGNSKLYVARTVTLPTPPPPPTCYTSGLMTAKVAGKNADSFTVYWLNGEAGKVPFQVNSDTKFYQNGKPASFADLKVGQLINFVVKSCGDGKYQALTVALPNQPVPASCNTSTATVKVVSKTADSFYVALSNGITSQSPLLVNGDTKFFHNDKPASFADLKAGQTISVTVKSCGDARYYAMKVIF